jgi:hypothetical protein
MKAIVNDDNGALLLSDLTFNACESKYSTPAQAYEACVDKVSNESK